MRLLDLFCSAGGAAVGYHRAGFDEIVGVDIKAQPRYPFHFVQGDALEFLASFAAGFDAIHASPPCQAYSRSMKHRQTIGKEKPKLIDATRALLERTGHAWIIENVVGSPIPNASTLFGDHGLELCGTAVGLPRVWRHRRFLASFPLRSVPCQHREAPLNPYNTKSRVRDGLQYGSMRAYAMAMDVAWMRDKEASLAIPPAYTEFIGKQLIKQC
jgi:DNA (cytosine-5)-methyltransferase 1